MMELDAIAAAVIGGTSLLGGQGTVWGALLGALVMASLDNGMSLHEHRGLLAADHQGRRSWWPRWPWTWPAAAPAASTSHRAMPHGDSIEAALRAYVDRGALAGAATLVWRDGRVVHTATLGRRDLVTNLPVERDTIFRIASMTKPLTTVAALTLYDEGRFALDEPIARHAPEFARLRVLRDPNGPLDQTDAAERPITFGDLLTHRSGLTYGELHRGPISRASTEALGGTMDNVLSPDVWIARLATLPLIDQPGAGFHYGLSTDLLGFLIARLEDALSAMSSSGASSGRWACATRVSSFLERSELAARVFAGSTPRGSWPP